MDEEASVTIKRILKKTDKEKRPARFGEMMRARKRNPNLNIKIREVDAVIYKFLLCSSAFLLFCVAVYFVPEQLNFQTLIFFLLISLYGFVSSIRFFIRLKKSPFFIYNENDENDETITE